MSRRRPTRAELLARDSESTPINLALLRPVVIIEIGTTADVRPAIEAAKRDPHREERTLQMHRASEGPGNTNHYVCQMVYAIADIELRAERGEKPTDRDLRNLACAQAATVETTMSGNPEWFVELIHQSATALRRLCGKGAAS